jgi:aspartyl-tRNA(Asn)/glutamyl-tRNA(Gln) amidotransferase subunit C
MAQFDKSTLRNLETLCRIKCTEKEEEGLLNSLKQILHHVEQLDEINTDGVEPCNYVLKEMQRTSLRDDEVKNVISNELFLLNAPEHIGKMIKVPTIIKQG